MTRERPEPGRLPSPVGWLGHGLLPARTEHSRHSRVERSQADAPAAALPIDAFALAWTAIICRGVRMSYAIQRASQPLVLIAVIQTNARRCFHPTPLWHPSAGSKERS